MPTPLPQIIAPIDHSPNEIESVNELAIHLDRGSLASLTVQGLALADVDLSMTDVAGTLFVGCTLSPRQVAELVQRGAHVVPIFADTPYPTQPARLYTADELAAGFVTGGFEAMYDTRVYQHYVRRGGATPDLREALAQRIHDHGIDNALAHDTGAWLAAHGPASVVGIMGGHAENRGSVSYRAEAKLAWLLARSGRLILTGGGPGVMEAANLGSYFATHSAAELSTAIDELATAAHFRDSRTYTARSLSVREQFRPAASVDWSQAGGLSIPTWFFGHEPANLFAARAAKMFSNSAREEIILKLSRGGLVFAEGRAGTVQEVFQAVTMTFYGTVNPSGPFIFLGRQFWTEQLPVASLLNPLLSSSPLGDQSHLVHITDDVDEAAALLMS